MDFTQNSCREFVEVLASSAPVPGGGGAAALVGAIGTALGNMVGSLTVGKKKYADVEAEIVALKAECDQLQKELLDQVPADAVGFEPLAKAYGIPKDNPDRDRILEEATIVACAVPMKPSINPHIFSAIVSSLSTAEKPQSLKPRINPIFIWSKLVQGILYFSISFLDKKVFPLWLAPPIIITI